MMKATSAGEELCELETLDVELAGRVQPHGDQGATTMSIEEIANIVSMQGTHNFTCEQGKEMQLEYFHAEAMAQIF